MERHRSTPSPVSTNPWRLDNQAGMIVINGFTTPINGLKEWVTDVISPLFQWSSFTPLFSLGMMSPSYCSVAGEITPETRPVASSAGTCMDHEWRISRNYDTGPMTFESTWEGGIFQVSLVSLWHKISDQRVKTEVLLSKCLDISHMGAFQEAAFMQPPLPFLSQVNQWLHQWPMASIMLHPATGQYCIFGKCMKMHEKLQ